MPISEDHIIPVQTKLSIGIILFCVIIIGVLGVFVLA